MLIGADAVETGVGRIEHLVERGVVVLADLLGVGDIEPQRIDISGLIALFEIRRQIPIRHQMEHADFHRFFSSAG